MWAIRVRSWASRGDGYGHGGRRDSGVGTQVLREWRNDRRGTSLRFPPKFTCNPHRTASNRRHGPLPGADDENCGLISTMPDLQRRDERRSRKLRRGHHLHVEPKHVEGGRLKEHPQRVVMRLMGIDRSRGDIDAIGFAEHEDGSGVALVLQRQSGPVSDDASGDYSVSNHLGATVYGGVEAWSLDDNLLSLQLAPATSTTLGFAPSFVLELAVDRPQFADLRQSLEVILGN